MFIEVFRIVKMYILVALVFVSSSVGIVFSAAQQIKQDKESVRIDPLTLAGVRDDLKELEPESQDVNIINVAQGVVLHITQAAQCAFEKLVEELKKQQKEAPDCTLHMSAEQQKKLNELPKHMEDSIRKMFHLQKVSQEASVQPAGGTLQNAVQKQVGSRQSNPLVFEIDSEIAHSLDQASSSNDLVDFGGRNLRQLMMGQRNSELSFPVHLPDGSIVGVRDLQ